MKRLVLMVEGDGDVDAVPVLVKRLLPQDAWKDLILDKNPLRVGESPGLAKDGFAKWRRLLQVAAKRPNFGGCLTILDGDSKKFENQPFCAMHAARRLSETAQDVGAGQIFSVACVIACMEFESWLIAGVESLAGRKLPDGRAGVNPGTVAPGGDLEKRKDAKGWLRRTMESGYSPTRDQAELTRIVDLEQIRNRNMRSFRRLEKAIAELVDAIRTDTPTVTPQAR